MCVFLLSQQFFSRPSARELAGGEPIPRADVYGAELVFIAGLLDKDVRNNSAWNQRFFVRTHAPPSAAAAAASSSSSSASSSSAVHNADPSRPPLHDMSSEVLHEEIAFTAIKLLLAPHNESPWNYLEGLLRQAHFGSTHRKDILHLIAALPTGKPGDDDDEAPLDNDVPEELLVARAAALPNRFAQSLLVELWQLPLPQAADSVASSSSTAGGAVAPRLDLAHAACLRLGGELDPLRAKYWQWRAQQIGDDAGSSASAATKQ
jgi:hypothetical protein